MRNAICLAVLAWTATTAYARTPAPITMDGVYVHRTDAQSIEVQGDALCFTPDEAAAKLLPRARNDQRLPGFCFANSAEARRQLRVPAAPAGACGSTAHARIVIDTYRVYTGDGDGTDTARLVSVSQVQAPQRASCGAAGQQ